MRIHLLPAVLLTCLSTSCAVVEDLDLSAIDFGIDEDTGDNVVAASARDFATCNAGKECNYLWSQAQIWLEENARFQVELKNETTLTAYNDVPDKHRQEFQYRITRVPMAGGVAKLHVESFCADLEACKDTTVEQVHKINTFLRAHKRALAEGHVELEGYEEPELPQGGTVAELPPESETLPDLSVEREYRQGRFQGQAKESLAGAGCLEQSKMVLLKSDGEEDLYDVECLTGIREIVFRCNRDGCSTLE